MCASSREYNLFTFDNHPILIRLLMCKVSMRYVCFPYFISTFWPLNWDLNHYMNMQQLIMSKTSLFIYHNREIYTISAHNMTATTQFFFRKRSMNAENQLHYILTLYPDGGGIKQLNLLSGGGQ